MATTPRSPGAEEHEALDFDLLDDRVRALRRCSLFAHWPPERLTEAAVAVQVRRYARGAQVFAGNPQRREVFVVASGRIEVSRGTASGKRFARNIIGPGEILGLIRLLARVPLHYDYHAYDDSVLLHLPSDALMGSLDAEPILWRDLALLLCERHGENMRFLNDQALGTLEQRMAAALVELAGMHGLIEDGVMELGLRLPQEQLGAMLGVTRQSVNRVLRALEHRGTIGTDYNRIIIRDFSALCDVAARRG